MPTYNLYINSKNRLSSEKTYDFNLYLQNQIIVNKNQGININVMSFSMINSMYNINETNNTFHIVLVSMSWLSLEDPAPEKIMYKIPVGNYSVISLRNWFNETFSNFKVTYNAAQNTFTFKIPDNTGLYCLLFYPTTCSDILGINKTNEKYNHQITSEPVFLQYFGSYGTDFVTLYIHQTIETSYINLVNYQQVILRCPSLQIEDLTQDNINDNDNTLNVSDILFWINKQDVEPFRTINYNNEDGCTSYSFNIKNENIRILNFKLCNEKNEDIEDAGDYLLQLKINVYDKDENYYKEMCYKIYKILDDIYFLMLNAFFNNKNINGSKKIM